MQTLNGRIVMGEAQQVTRPKSHPKRHCEECGTKLSRYNSNTLTCWLHSPLNYPRVRGKINRGGG